MCTPEVRKLKELYREKHGEMFIPFNYVDFPGTDTQLASEMYIEILKAAVESDKPYAIMSHRYDIVDH